MPNPVVHWEITSKEPGKAQEFYSKLFDWHVDANNPMNYGLVDAHVEGSPSGGIGPTQGGPGWVTVYVQVDDLQAYLNKAESLGGARRSCPLPRSPTTSPSPCSPTPTATPSAW